MTNEDPTETMKRMVEENEIERTPVSTLLEDGPAAGETLAVPPGVSEIEIDLQDGSAPVKYVRSSESAFRVEDDVQ